PTCCPSDCGSKVDHVHNVTAYQWQIVRKGAVDCLSCDRVLSLQQCRLRSDFHRIALLPELKGHIDARILPNIQYNPLLKVSPKTRSHDRKTVGAWSDRPQQVPPRFISLHILRITLID